LKFLLDTHLLLWAAEDVGLVPKAAREFMADAGNELHYSVVSLWEVAIKQRLSREDFRHDARVLRRGLRDNRYHELPVSGDHAVAVAGLQSLHRDPFDRLLIAQATVEGIMLMTCDPQIAQYPGPILKL